MHNDNGNVFQYIPAFQQKRGSNTGNFTIFEENDQAPKPLFIYKII